MDMPAILILDILFAGLVILLSIPALYEKYEDQVDRYADIAYNEFRKLFSQFNAHVISKIPKNFSKGKKMQ